MRRRPPFSSCDFQILPDTLGLSTIKTPKLAHMDLCAHIKIHMGRVYKTSNFAVFPTCGGVADTLKSDDDNTAEIK